MTVPSADQPEDRDGGFATLEFAVLFPLVILAITVVFQLSLWGARRSAVISAAQDTAAQAAIRGGADTEFLTDQLANHGLGQLNLRTSVGVDGDRVQVTIDGSMPSIIPGVSLLIHAVASAPAEHFRP
jgi:Flp pilus assembly protein TadG